MRHIPLNASKASIQLFSFEKMKVSPIQQPQNIRPTKQKRSLSMFLGHFSLVLLPSRNPIQCINCFLLGIKKLEKLGEHLFTHHAIITCPYCFVSSVILLLFSANNSDSNQTVSMFTFWRGIVTMTTKV